MTAQKAAGARGWRRVALGAGVAVVVLVAAACGGAGGGDQPESEAADVVPAAATGDGPTAPGEPGPSQAVTSDGRGEGAEPVVAEQSGPGLSRLGAGLAEFDRSALAWNSYWYSRYNLGTVVMQSGLGVPFAPAPEDVAALMALADQGPADGEHVSPPSNPALLKAVYAGGDPALVQPFNGDPADFANFRWDAAATDATITPAAQAQTIVKEIEWAKQFNSPLWGGRLTDDFGAMDRFRGLVLFTEAKMQTMFALAELRNEDGLFVAASTHEGGETQVVDPQVSLADQYQMLTALADLSDVLSDTGAYNGIYADAELAAVIDQAATGLFRAVAAYEPAGAEELARAAQALTWYARAADQGPSRSRALTLLRQVGDELTDLPAATLVARAQAIRGLVEAGRVLDEPRFLERAGAHFTALAEDYDPGLGVFEGTDRLTVGQLADVVGALNALQKHARDFVDEDELNRTFLGFFEATINRSGLQQAAPPKEIAAAPFELERVRDDLYFAYPTIPAPLENGRAPVFASEIAFDEQAGHWVVADPSYDTAGAMHLANELMWTFGLIDGFPQPDA